MDVGELLWVFVLHRPNCAALDHQRKHVLRPLLFLNYLHSCPFLKGGLLFPDIFSDISIPVESGDNVYSFGFMDPQGRSSVSNAPTFAADRHLQDLRIRSLFVAFRLEFKGDFPLFGELGEGCEKATPPQQVFAWKRECSCPIEKATLALSILKEDKL